MSDSEHPKKSEEEIRNQIAFADAALAVAGHEITDPFTRDLMERVARDEMTAEQAIEELRRHVQGS